MKKENWLPRKGNKFNAIQRKTGIPARDNPQTRIKGGGHSCVAAKDAAGNERLFCREDWKYEKV